MLIFSVSFQFFVCHSEEDILPWERSRRVDEQTDCVRMAGAIRCDRGSFLVCWHLVSWVRRVTTAVEIQSNTMGVEEATLVKTFEWFEDDLTLDTRRGIQVALSVDSKWSEDHGPNSLPPRPPAVDQTPCGPLSRWWHQLVASLELPLGIRRIPWG